MTTKLESTHGTNGCRRFFKSDIGNLVIEVTTVKHDRDSKHSLMNLWVEKGWMPKFISTTLSINTYYTDAEGNCFGMFNPQIQTGINELGNPYPEINFLWMLEATPENEKRILDECERLMLEDLAK